MTTTNSSYNNYYYNNNNNNYYYYYRYRYMFRKLRIRLAQKRAADKNKQIEVIYFSPQT
jgi:hypothetical protein